LMGRPFLRSRGSRPAGHPGRCSRRREPMIPLAAQRGQGTCCSTPQAAAEATSPARRPAEKSPAQTFPTSFLPAAGSRPEAWPEDPAPRSRGAHP
jgi:hypothetical protein